MASKLRGAVSRDRAAAADTWYKWDGAAFSRRGLGEEGERFRDTSNRPLPSGEHPSIHWNRSPSPYCGVARLQRAVCRYLRQWVMVWNGYDGRIYVTSATRLPRFQPPRVLIPKQNTRQKNWYPTLLSKQLGQCPIVL